MKPGQPAVDHISMWMLPWPWTMTHLWIKLRWKVRYFNEKSPLEGDTDKQISLDSSQTSQYFLGGSGYLKSQKKISSNVKKFQHVLPFGSNYFATPIRFDINSIWISLISPLAMEICSLILQWLATSKQIRHLTSISHHSHQTTTPPQPPFPTSCCRQCPPQDTACANGLEILRHVKLLAKRGKKEW